MTPKISVVIPTFNRAHSIGRTIESALLSRNVEVIVVDDGSTDETPSVLSAFGDRIVSVGQKNSGVSEARNHGLRLARGPCIKFLDSDDTLVPGSLERQLDELHRLPVHGVPVGELTDSTDPVSTTPDIAAVSDPINTFEMASKSIQVSQPLLRSDAVRDVGGFSNSAMAEDFDLFLRLHMAGTRFYKTGTPVTVFDDAPASGRLSRSNIGSRFAAAHGMYAGLAQQALEWNDPEAPTLRRGLGQHLWSLGRRLTRENAVKEARKCFTLARQLAGRKAYKANLVTKLMYHVFDPIKTEMILNRWKNF